MAYSPRSPRSLPSRVSLPARSAVALLLAGALAGCGSSEDPTLTESATEGGGPVSRVEIEADTGSVELRRGADGASQVQRTLRWSGDRKPVYTQNRTGNTLTITARCPDGDGECGTDLVVTVPAAASSRTDVTTGSVTVDGLTGAQDLTATTGPVRGTGLGAAPVTARTTTGSVALGFAAAPSAVEAEATTGDVDIEVPVGPVYQVQARVQTGQSRVEVADTPGAEHRISARSTTGSVSVTNG